ncbi:MAG: hypothetical protein K2K60_00025 [Clostridia bacterium]|nr:hypothetical protein [Clostridia bacterium]
MSENDDVKQELKDLLDNMNSYGYKRYSGNDLSMLLGISAFFAAALILPFVAVLLNGYSFTGKIFANIFMCVGPILAPSGGIVIYLLIRINIINKFYCFEFNGKSVLIKVGFFRRTYKIGNITYVLKKGQAQKITVKKSESAKTLFSILKSTDIEKKVKGDKVVYSTKLLDSYDDWLIDSGLSRVPSKYGYIKFKGGYAVKGIIDGSQRHCAMRFKFFKLSDEKIKKLIPECLL